MAHGDDDGVILPPRVAPTQVVILPVTPKPETRESVMAACESLAEDIRSQSYHGDSIRVEIDDRDLGGGVKNWEWIKKGVPVRIEIGPRDLEKGSVALARRDRAPKDKAFLASDEVAPGITDILQSIHDGLLDRARRFRRDNTIEVDSIEALRDYFADDQLGGFALAHWAGSSEDEERLAKEMKISIRCIPKDPELRGSPGTCVGTGLPAEGRVVFSRAY